MSPSVKNGVQWGLGVGGLLIVLLVMLLVALLPEHDSWTYTPQTCVEVSP